MQTMQGCDPYAETEHAICIQHMQVMDAIKAKKKWDSLALEAGHINIDMLMRA